MSFQVPAADYDRFMGRYVPTLAVALADAADVRDPMHVLDVGCGPGGLTSELASRVGAGHVAAIDPAPQFAAACRERVAGADVREGVAEELPWADGTFDAALSSLVVAFMRDADAGIAEMARVTRPGGTVAACMWDLQRGGMTMLHTFWTVVHEVAPGADNENRRAGTAEGDIADRMRRAGLDDVRDGAITAHADYTGFDDFWAPFALAVGPAGEFMRKLTNDQQERIRDGCRERLPDGAFTLDARAWFARGTKPA